MTYFGCVCLVAAGLTPRGWLWLFPLMLPLTGALIQATSTRVRLLRVFETLGWLPPAVAFAAAAWRVFTLDGNTEIRLLLALKIGSLTVAIGLLTARARLRSPALVDMPCGAFGHPDPTTGIVRDLSRKGAMRTEAKDLSWGALTFALGPLVIAFTRQWIRSQAVSSQLLLFGVGALYFAGFAMWASGWSLAHIIAISRWEQRHGKKVRLTG